MESAIQILPARCMLCGALFDMSFDLQGIVALGEEDMKDVALRFRPRLCWKCRF